MYKKSFITCTLFAALLAAAPAAQARQARPSKRIAVLAFKNLRPNTDTDWIGAGAAETLTTKLAAVPGLVAIERSQVRQLAQEKGFQESDLADPKGAAKAGKLLGAERVVLGTYAADGDALIFNVRVVDVQTGAILSAAAVTGSKTKIFDTLFQLADAVVKSFDNTVVIVDNRPTVRPAPQGDRIALTAEQKTQLRKPDTTSRQAYEAYARAAAADPDDKLRWTTRAIGFDPKFTAAYRRRAQAYAAKGQHEKAIADCNKAIADTPGQAEAYRTRGLVYLQQDRNGRAVKDFNKAIELAPSDAAAYFYRAMARYRKKEYRKAWNDMTAARELGHTIPPAFETALERALARH
ncbi:MAG: tetratricopeptide repeat protein [Planctomycetota bacterium]